MHTKDKLRMDVGTSIGKEGKQTHDTTIHLPLNRTTQLLAALGTLRVPAITAGQCAGRKPSLFLLFYGLVMGFLQLKI